MLLLLTLVAIDIYILMNTGKPKKESHQESDVEWTVYGTNWCGWTKKQLKYLENKGIPHKFIDCEKSKCDGIDAFPVMESSNGEKVTGYKEV